MTERERLAFEEAHRRQQPGAVTPRPAVPLESAHIDERIEPDGAVVRPVAERTTVETISGPERVQEVSERSSFLSRLSQVIDYLFYLIYGLIALEIILDLLGARRANAFREFVHALTTPLLAPFNNLLPDPAAGRFQFRLSHLVALVVYILLHLAITGLLRLIVQRKTTI
jgi:uncharacterized protein YggT (Ycf19 family)